MERGEGLEWFFRIVKEEKVFRNVVRLSGRVKGYWRLVVKNLNGVGLVLWA